MVEIFNGSFKSKMGQIRVFDCCSAKILLFLEGICKLYITNGAE